MDFYLAEQDTNIKRYVVSRPEAAAIVLYHKENNELILIRQFRAPLFDQSADAFICEIPAGVLEKGENASDTIIRETLEETGYQITHPLLIKTIYPSPGILDEKIHLFYAEVTDAQKVSKGGGIDAEKEFLEVLHFPPEKIKDMIFNDQISDAKSIIGIMLAKEKGYFSFY